MSNRRVTRVSVRWLYPARIVPSGDVVWLIDHSRPAAAVVEPDGSLTFVHWPGEELRFPSPQVVGTGDGGIVVQNGSSVTWVWLDRHTTPIETNGLHLSAADAEFAWLVDRRMLSYQIPGDADLAGRWADANGGDDAAADDDESGRIEAVRPDGTRLEVRTPLPVKAIEADGDDGDELVLVFSERPVSHDRSDGSGSMEYPTSEQRISRTRLLAGDLSGAVTPRRRWGPHDDHDRGRGKYDEAGAGTELHPVWLERDPELVLRYGVRAAGLVWWVGSDPSGDQVSRHVLVRGHDSRSGDVVVALDTGLGFGFGFARAVGDEVWIAIARQRMIHDREARGVEVIAVCGDGSWRQVYAPDSIDISITDPVPDPRPPQAEIDTAVRALRSRFDHLAAYWRGSDGVARPLTNGLREPGVSVEGEWPRTKIVVTLRHESRPGLLLRRTHRVFDDYGRRAGYIDPAIDLMEDLDTDYLPPADEAVDGVLDI
jgi:hypothetical protein